MFNKITGYLSKVDPILFFSKAMAGLIVIASTAQFAMVNATQAFPAIDYESLKASLIQWILGLVAASATVIAGYVAAAIKMAVKYAYDFIRARIANTIIGEMIDDMNTLANNSTDIFEDKLGKALANDGKVDQKEINEIVDALHNKFVEIYGIEKVKYLEKYRPQAILWIKSKFEELVRQWVESFRWSKLRRNNSIVESNK